MFDFDRYMEEQYVSVPGMSSAFSARICTDLLRGQAGSHWGGHVAEIGAFEGRFLIALLSALQAGERAVAIDRYDWPDIHVNVRLDQRLRLFGLRDRVDIVCGDSRTMTPEMIAPNQAQAGFRFFHVDGDHQRASLVQDMQLAFACMLPYGVVCLDDMLSPAYPELMLGVAESLEAHPDWRVFCIIDREDIAASAKFLLCRHDYADHYSALLSQRFAGHVWKMQAQFATHQAVVLAPAPRLQRFNLGGTVDTLQS
ncbi:class I SAM-dependent methyltransferase [Xanthomonas maliensis]|uniref:class I SAM-dependent methyltransferase n=1 Tax=Xanthomonas maliensis TaxID=1321368 RepID=UPI0003A9E891|nr:class I SAM-dependent methyltransferase [Xanthomonas maliensis]KAB7766662.1 class I SAM-dependent methyltransferase [Xanthomonas maliensis]